MTEFRKIVNDRSERLTQIKDKTPPDTKKTLNHLLKIGYTRKEALNLIGGVVLAEIYDMLKAGKPYDEMKYTNTIKKLK